MFTKIIVTSPWYFFAISIIIGFIIAIIPYYKNKKNTDAPKSIILILFGLRFISSLLLIFLLLNIFVKQLKNNTEKPIILFAIDNSSSIVSNQDSVYIKSVFQEKIAQLKEKIGKNFNFKTILFGNKVNTTEKLPNFSAKETDIENLMIELETSYSNQNIGALILVSDGIYNKGSDPTLFAEKLGYPVYSIALGDTLQFKDISIQKINHNQLAYLGNDFPAEVIIQANKYQGKELEVTLLKNGKVQAKKKINVTTSNFIGTCSFTLNSEVKDLVKYDAKVTIINDEKNKFNNTQSFLIDILDNKEKILLLANQPHPDVSCIKEAILKGTNYELENELITQFNKPLNPFSLVIIHGYSSANSDFLTNCKKNKIPVWIINPLTSVNLPGIKINAIGNEYNETEALVEKNFSLFSLSDKLSIFINNSPALNAFFGYYSLSNGSNSLINQKVGQIETKNPVLFFYENNNLKQGVFIGDGLWKWKMRDFVENKTNDLFFELIRKTIQYLSVKSDKSFFRLVVPKITNENTPIEIIAELYNKSYELTTLPEINFKLSDKQKKIFSYTFSKTSSSYQLNLGVLGAGEYQYEATVKYNNELYVKKGKILVNELLSENINTVANHQLLYKISSRSNGKMFYPKDIMNIEIELLKNNTIKSITYSQKSTFNLIDFNWFFIFIIILLSFEWLLRKRFLTI